MGHAHFGVTSHLGKLAITLLLRGVPASTEMDLDPRVSLEPPRQRVGFTIR
jgi:hypothetical protein